MDKYSETFATFNGVSDTPRWNSQSPAVPVNKDGALMEADYYHIGYRDGYVVFPETFHASLLLIRFDRGRSASNIVFRDLHRGYEYYMKAHDALEMIKEGYPSTGLHGEFKMTKKGSAFRIELVRLER